MALFWRCSDSSLGVCICCVIEKQSSTSLWPRISTDDDTRRACHTFTGVGTRGISRAATASLSSAGPDLADWLRPLTICLPFQRAVWLLLFASLVTLCFACLSLPSQWPILHHRWGRQKGETTAHLLFGETRSAQLSERMKRERQC